MQVIPFEADSVELTAGSMDDVPRGWYAPSFGVLNPAPVLVLNSSGKLPHTFGYLLLPRFAGDAYARCTREAFLLRIDVVIDDWQYQITCVQDEIDFNARQWRQ